LLRAVAFFSNKQSTKSALPELGIHCIATKERLSLSMSDFRSISLIHSFAKLISKVLANILAPHLKHLVSNNQTAFIKIRCIHDSFAYVQGIIKLLHKKHTPALFIKLDILKAFDIVN
jgi:hypothetical protein